MKPDCVAAAGGTGYPDSPAKPLSLSLPYATKVTGTRDWLPLTPMYGMPYGGGPKSGWDARVRPM